MVRIITGKINQNKTSRAKKHYEDEKKGDGFLAIKTMADDIVKSYHAIRLSNQESHILVLREDFYDDSFTIAYQIGPYLFSAECIIWMEEWYDLLIKETIEPLYIDEIGLLELKNQGLSKIFRKLLASNLDLVVVIRIDCLEEIIKKYEIRNYEIISS